MPQTSASVGVRILLHVLFLLSGVATVLIGQVLPILGRKFSLDDLELSFFFPAQFAGSLIGTIVTSRFGRRNRYFAAASLGVAAMAAGVLLMNADSFAGCLAGFLVNGLGIGLTLPSINMLIVEMSLGREASALSILNFCWGVGAIICKPFVDAFSGNESLGRTTYLLAIPLIVGVFTLIGPFIREEPAATYSAEDSWDAPIWKNSIAWLIALFNFIHVGFESGIGGWLTTYTGRVPGEPLATWLSPTLLYFSFFVIGRGFAPVLFRFLTENKMLLLGLAIILTGMAVILAADNVIALSLGASLAGFGTSWIFPTNIARFTNTFGPTATRRATPLFLAGTLGAASSTWLIGFISNASGSLHSGMYVLLAAIAMLMVLQIFLSLGTRRRVRA